MQPDEAFLIVQEKFPFDNYIKPVAGGYINIAKTALRHLSPGAKILDFGAGPCDKTAILQTLGFHCAAFDDLQDPWHRLSDNRQKIFEFTNDLGIEFYVAEGNPPPFAEGQFDMLMMHDVLEHLHHSPKRILNEFLEFVRPEGFLFITVPNAVNIRKRLGVLAGRTNLPPFDYYWHSGEWRGHVREYARNDCIQLAEHLGLDIVELNGCNHMLHKIPTRLRRSYIVFSKLFPNGRDTWMMVAKKKPGWKPIA